jgi:hypothetical protein
MVHRARPDTGPGVGSASGGGSGAGRAARTESAAGEGTTLESGRTGIVCAGAAPSSSPSKPAVSTSRRGQRNREQQGNGKRNVGMGR